MVWRKKLRTTWLGSAALGPVCGRACAGTGAGEPLCFDRGVSLCVDRGVSLCVDRGVSPCVDRGVSPCVDRGASPALSAAASARRAGRTMAPCPSGTRSAGVRRLGAKFLARTCGCCSVDGACVIGVHVCMCVCTETCMHACMHGSIHARMYVCMYVSDPKADLCIYKHTQT